MLLERQIFDELYYNFWEKEIVDKDYTLLTNNTLSLIDKKKQFLSILEFGSGIGLLAYHFALAGHSTIGIEESSFALKKSDELGLKLDNLHFVHGTWMNYNSNKRHDLVVIWGTTLCSGTEIDKATLKVAYDILNEDGCLLIEQRNWSKLCRNFEVTSLRKKDQDFLIEEHSYDITTGIQSNTEHFYYQKNYLKRKYEMRRYVFPELIQLVLTAGFKRIEAYDENAEPLSNNSNRSILIAYKSNK